jgi:hypothetical protein
MILQSIAWRIGRSLMPIRYVAEALFITAVLILICLAVEVLVMFSTRDELEPDKALWVLARWELEDEM